MFGDQKDTQKNLKDSENKSVTPYGASSQGMPFMLSYTKTNKLITALYMVTDIIDKEEPLRNKLRTLGTGIISDINTAPINICSKISEIMSFLDIAGAVNIISSMNCNILRKEFMELDQSIRESTNIVGNVNKQINLSEFFTGELSPKLDRKQSKSIGHKNSARLGVQKGGTLMQALSDTTLNSPNTVAPNVFKKERREEIIKIIKNSSNGTTITDIKTQASGPLVSCSEKTLQRELISMVKDNVLYKTGKKRWSRYFLARP